jgi:hypothetical protein
VEGAIFIASKPLKTIQHIINVRFIMKHNKNIGRMKNEM